MVKVDAADSIIRALNERGAKLRTGIAGSKLCWQAAQGSVKALERMRLNGEDLLRT